MDVLFVAAMLACVHIEPDRAVLYVDGEELPTSCVHPEAHVYEGSAHITCDDPQSCGVYWSGGTEEGGLGSEDSTLLACYWMCFGWDITGSFRVARRADRDDPDAVRLRGFVGCEGATSLNQGEAELLLTFDILAEDHRT